MIQLMNKDPRRPIWFNPSHIVWLEEADGGGTRIFTTLDESDSSGFVVTGPPDAVADAIKVNRLNRYA